MVGPDSGRALSVAEREAALAYIAATPAIWEVILTGGDPFVLSARRLAEVSRQLAAITHVKVLRVHTRVPVAAPGRITPSLLRALRASGKAVYVVVHANHPRELTDEVKAALGRMADAGIALLSQSVLLRGVNDDAETLGTLMRSFVECRVKPYYLHHLDHAPGTARFRAAISSGQRLMRDLHGRYSGLCQPHYVLDIPGGFGKSPIGPNYLRQSGVSVANAVGETAGLAVDDYEVEDYKGLRHRYRSSV
jgi:lysine 2,3-aminomutase